MKPVIEIFRFEMPHPQAFDSSEGPKIGGTRGEVAVRLADDHGIWESAETLREALRAILRSIKVNNERPDETKRPIFIEGYIVEFIDTVRSNAFYSDGREIEYSGGRLL